MVFVTVLLLGALLPRLRHRGGSILRVLCYLFKVRKLEGEEGSYGRVKSAFWMLLGIDER